MELHAHIIQSVALSVGRDDEVAVVDAEVGVAHIGLYDEVTLEVVATRGAYHINKRLIV